MARDQEKQPAAPPILADEPRGGLASVTFLGLLLTQLLGAANDNIFRWLVIGIGKQYVKGDQIGNILMAGTASFVLPYLILAAPAGYFADRFSKRTVIVACKLAEIAIMTLGTAAIISGNLWFLFGVVLMMGAQSALFGPAKLGSIPEMLKAEKISAANGLMGLTTVIATVIGMAIGNVLVDTTGVKGQERWWLSGAVLVGVAAAGLLASLGIARLPVANRARNFPWDAARQTYRDLATLASRRALLRVAWGIAFFWSLGAMAQLNIDQFAFEGGATVQSETVPLLISLVFGVGLGSVLAGVWSGGRVELGILPLGAGGVAAASILLFTVEGTLINPGSDWTASYVAACMLLFGLGISAGLFDVPLAAYMQHHSPRESRGSILAASNFMTFSGILLAALFFSIFRAPLISSEPLLSSRQIFLVCGVCTIPVFIYIVWLIPQASIRFAVWLATHTIYRVRTEGRQNLPETGGALLVANHVSWVDGVLLLVSSSRPIRLVVHADLIQGWFARRLARSMRAIAINSTPKAAAAAIREVRQALSRGELVCIFPEGTMTRTGQLQGFKRGLIDMVQGTGVPVIPVYLDELWGSIFSFRGGQVFWKRPRAWPFPVSIWFGTPIADADHVRQIRRAVEDLGAEAVNERTTRSMLLPSRFIRQCRARMFRPKVADSTGAELSGGSLLMRTLILRRLLLREVLGPDERFVGLLLPPSVGGVVANTAVTLAGRVSANLNYTASSKTINDCIKRAKIRHVLTSRRVMEKLDLELDAELVYLEDFRERVTTADKIAAAMGAYLFPVRLLERRLKLTTHGDDVMTVIFTSGSTAQPKGVLLTHKNIVSNVDAIDEVVQLRSDDVIVGVLPFFHSFGFTVTLWTVLGLDVKGVYHFSPLDARQIGKLCHEHRGTVLLATPTFLRSYLRRCDREEFVSLEVVVVGAEKMPIELAAAFEEKFGVRPVEGYGTTELSPLVSVNIPPGRSPRSELDRKEGTVGRPVPGVSAKIVHAESFEELPQGEEGMLLIKGPNVMQGYLDDKEKTAEVIRDGWYVTGDMARIDENGFIEITGRLSRFSKIGGEMVPHLRIEEELLKIITQDGDHASVAVTAVPDERKGERLVVLYTELPQTPDKICRILAEEGLPNLWIPSPDSFCQVEEIPILGTGKLDLRGLKQLALDKCSKKA